jgi:hypothetical protein
MTLMPGVQSSGDMASGFNVRGGNTDQNLILLDEVPVYNSTHLFGMFSVIDSRAINNIELYKGVAPARYGGRISSFMDIDQKEGNLKSTEVNGSLGLFSSKLGISAPIVKDKAAVMLGARTTYSDWILKRIPDVDIRNSSANFHDVNAKYTWMLNRKNIVNAFGYYSKDYFNLAGTSIYQYSNTLGSVSWDHISGEKYFFSLRTFYTEYNTETTDNENEALAITINSGIKQYGSRFRILLKPWARHSFESGAEGNIYLFNPGVQKPYGSESVKESESLEKAKAAEFAVYLQDVYDVNSWLSVSAGFRFAYFAALGPTTVNLYSSDELIDETTFTRTSSYKKGEIIKSYPAIEPRLSVKAGLGNMTSLKFGYSRNYQNLHMLSNSTVAIPTDSWTPSSYYIRPTVADQVSLGVFKNFMKGIIEASVEGYYKNVSDVPEFKSGAQLVMNPDIEQEILFASMKAYGIEFLLRKNAGRFTGWVGYTYSRSFLQTSGKVKGILINEGREYPSYYDKPHDLSIITNYKISRRFSLSSLFTYSTGRPATYPESQFYVHHNPVIGYSDRNKYRLPDYHRLDVSLTLDTSLKKKKKLKSSWVFSVYNVYGHKNVYSTYYQRDIPTDKNDYKKFAFYELSIIGVPIPSITYNLTF